MTALFLFKSLVIKNQGGLILIIHNKKLSITQKRIYIYNDMEVDLIQTLKDKGNPEQVESDGPFICTRPHAWLGFGYYFWDTHIELGHWWGETTLNNSYIICSANAIIDKTCWDLHNNQKHLMAFSEALDEIVDKEMTTYAKAKVPEVIEYIKKKGMFKYKAIRALGLRSVSSQSNYFQLVNFDQPGQYDKIIRFDEKLPAHLDMLPAIQICLLEKTALSLSNYRIIYPEEYEENNGNNYI